MIAGSLEFPEIWQMMAIDNALKTMFNKCIVDRRKIADLDRQKRR